MSSCASGKQVRAHWRELRNKILLWVLQGLDTVKGDIQKRVEWETNILRTIRDNQSSSMLRFVNLQSLCLLYVAVKYALSLHVFSAWL